MSSWARLETKIKNNKSRGTTLLLLLSFIDSFNNPIQQLCKFSIKIKIKVDSHILDLSLFAVNLLSSKTDLSWLLNA